MKRSTGFFLPKGGVTMSAPYSGGFALIVVLFILLIIVGCACVIY
ncbi:hypothetical protein GTCCBUS3UF5_7250 [Geobacillus thermoleovorans CCB_US3_UF5]|uniref:Sporulation protein YjcZ n=4 Tax=Geobacillus TaxID=129337 RepID=A0A1Q5SMZ2_9BACL|nr:hypothetical protein GTCCBUS3UF5_7250 [Geobacillus thermoleovorans CCB_US3_UF5]OKO89303.1 hypothetical protein BRO54_3373 [Geobacillus proteiniphilus]OPX04917.1 sporulation protein YjcZ [Geobacillus sp. LEMMY01]OQP14733.1 sporulation protein YjcZ [Geobacillus thermoleovorans]OQP16541.1 sporulation protein YjcZ [Geobacillus zalihae]OXB86828.1 sporulation protein YjcZ [Geobacillus thermocatenulatus]GAD13816.1 hypothetical conserved protein [Geobacillus kaustophilus GBlys]